MKILYVHHAERDRSNKSIDRQLQDITDKGITETEFLGEKLKNLNLNIKAIYTSPYLRCKHTAEILNKYLNIPIYEETKFNEMHSYETWKEFSIRNMEAIDNIVKNNDDNDFIICITSGVNLSPFVYYFTNITPEDNSPKIQAVTISPVLFSTDGSCL